jgi:hypothetical protein
LFLKVPVHVLPAGYSRVIGSSGLKPPNMLCLNAVPTPLGAMLLLAFCITAPKAVVPGDRSSISGSYFCRRLSSSFSMPFLLCGLADALKVFLNILDISSYEAVF